VLFGISIVMLLLWMLFGGKVRKAVAPDPGVGGYAGSKQLIRAGEVRVALNTAVVGLAGALAIAAGIWHLSSKASASRGLGKPIEILSEWRSLSVDEAHASVLGAISSGSGWGPELEGALENYAQALAASGLDRGTIAQRLEETGVTRSGAVEVVDLL
jgi:hypothetical protein